MRSAMGLLGIVAASAVLVACGSSSAPESQTTAAGWSIPADAGHVHGIVRARSGALLVGTHGGIFTPGDGGDLRRVGDAADYMGLAAIPSGGLLSSGHPAPGSTEPNPLGLRLSRDDGATWTTIRQVPRDDYHVIEAAAGRIYAVGSDGAVYAGAAPTTMATVGEAPDGLIDLAIDPGRAASLLATTESGLMRSGDAGRTWSQAGGEIGLLSWAPGALFIVDADGTVSVSADAGESWADRGSIGGPPAALLATSRTALVAATHDGRIVSSSDGGRTWS